MVGVDQGFSLIQSAKTERKIDCYSMSSKSDFDAEQSGHVQSSGMSLKRVPAGIPSSGKPRASS
jgi:hypothetical protein